jgi:hypothetical protein
MRLERWINERRTGLAVSWKSILLISLHLFALNGVFVFRFPTMREAIERREAWAERTFSGSTADYVRLYFTTIVERNYYEWTTAVLGKTLEADYPVFEGNREELETLMSEAPRFRVPYREVFFEYPPALMAPILAARIPSETFWGFTRALAFVISLAYLACLWVAYRIWQHLPAERRLSWPTVLLLSLSGISALGQIYVTRLDVFPSLVVLLAIWTFLERRWLLSAVWVAVGVLTKGYAIVLAPLFGLVLLRQVRYRALAVATTTVVTILLLTNIWLGWITDGVYWESFRFHAARGLQIESMYALVPYLGNLLFNVPINVYVEYNSVNIKMVNGGGWLLTASTILPVVGMLALCFMFWRVLRTRGAHDVTPLLVVRTATLFVFLFFLTFKVLSPQFLIWLTPLLYLIDPRHSKAFFATFLGVMLLTQMIWPNFYWLLEEAHPVGVLMLLARNAGLITLFAWLAMDSWQEGRPGPLRTA